jgi:O-antigen/teichoic acid export membrane protein
VITLTDLRPSILPRPTSLRASVITGSAWTLGGYGTGQLIRLARSLILTRLLFPEAFGVMAVVWAIMYGLEMLSDAGLGPAIVRHERGDSPEFLNTAWTIQVVRGGVLWTAACAIAWPLAAFYGQPDLVLLVPAVGLTAIIGGFASTAVHTCRRKMQFQRLTMVEVGTELVGLLATTLMALAEPSVWALIGGVLVSRTFATVASHTYLPGIRNSFHWDRSAVTELVSFGKWIYLSSAFHFLSIQGDRLLLAYYLDMRQLGIYSIAIMLADAVHALIMKITRGVLLPAYAKVASGERARLLDVSSKARLGLDIIMVLPIGVLAVAAKAIVAVLYDARYQDAGWIFQLLCIRLFMATALLNAECCLVALGHSRYAFWQSISRAVWIVLSIPVGWSHMGVRGVVLAVALSELPVMGVLWFGLLRHRLFSLWCEARSLLFGLLGVLLGIGAQHFMA